MLKVKYLRMIKGVSQSRLERDLKINHAIYSAIEGERMTRPYDFIMEKLSTYLECPVDELLTTVTPEQEAEVIAIDKAQRSKSGRQGGHSTLLMYGRKHMQNIGRKGSTVANASKTKRERSA